VPADTAMGFATDVPGLAPVLLEPTMMKCCGGLDVKDTFRSVPRQPPFKVWWRMAAHSATIKRSAGFFTGRYIFDGVAGFLR